MNRILNNQSLVLGSARKAPQWIKSFSPFMLPPGTLAWIICSLLFANTMAFACQFSEAPIISDAWYFLDVFVRKALDGTLSLSDFFVRRAGFDHAQPLKKLLLLFELRYFHLNFRIGAIVGVIFAFASLLIVRAIMLWREPLPNRTTHWLWVMACVTIFSLNSVTVWTWGLVTAGFMFYSFMLALFVCLWRTVCSGKYGLLIVVAFVVDIIGDDRALIVGIACLLALLLAALRNKTYRHTALRAAIILIACYIAARISYAFLYTAPAIHTMGAGVRLGRVAHAFIHGGWYQWTIVPLGQSVISRVPLTSQPLSHYIGGAAKSIQLTIGSLLLIAHVWFWYRAYEKPLNIRTFSAVALMLVVYGMLAGIVWARVPTYGNDVFLDARYVLIYCFGNVALLLMCAGCGWSHMRQPRLPTTAVAALVVALIVLQLPLSRAAWIRGPWITQYHAKIADQIWYIARTNDVPKDCMRQVRPCQYGPEKRAELIGLLKKHHLNIFSPDFQRATRLYPPPLTGQR